MKNTHKCNMSSLLSTCNLGPQVSVESSRDDGVFLHVEADVTIISYLFQAADDGRQVVRILTDDSDIFVQLVFWTWRYGSQDKLVVQMEKMKHVVLDINATCASLGQASLSVGNFPVLLDVHGEEGATQADLMETVLHSAIRTSRRHIFKNRPMASCSWRKMDLESISNIK